MWFRCPHQYRITSEHLTHKQQSCVSTSDTSGMLTIFLEDATWPTIPISNGYTISLSGCTRQSSNAASLLTLNNLEVKKEMLIAMCCATKAGFLNCYFFLHFNLKALPFEENSVTKDRKCKSRNTYQGALEARELQSKSPLELRVWL